ncbi:MULTISPECIES: ABC1 kinase family protein [Kocuria]|jgi:ubiquinone biosynthesis protein|uniref:ABC1 kinase family protein n=1 Tax=Kocuria TaxID=57493 RepID=UPI00203E9E2D|nr:MULTISPECIES: AarF/ABC1/UbiB kinase family protein [Kocuria]MCM3687126.1 AarF/ABC1/UbiB kinase family protein [Kocuria rosea]
MISRRERFLQILEVLSKHGFGFALGGIKEEWRAPLARVRLIDPDKLYSQPVHLRQALEELGPTFVKLGQLVSTRPDLLPARYVQELARLQDNSPPVPPERIRAMIESEPDSAAEEILAEIDPVPLATGSIGQAHAAVYHGADVVVKVRRPGVVEEVNRDLEILAELAKLLSTYWPAVKHFDLAGLADEFAQSLRDELDYLTEARNAQRMAENFMGDPRIHVPRIHWEATTSRILTMERIRGIKINDYPALEAAGLDRHLLAVDSTEAICRMIFEHGFFHADPHPGNLFVEPGGRIGIIDFGMVGSLSEEFRDNLVTVMLGVVQQNARRAAAGLLGLTWQEQDVDRKELERDVALLLRRYANRPLHEVRIGHLMGDLIGVLRRHRMHLPRESALFLRMLVTAESVGTGLDPEFDLVSVLTPYAERFVLHRLSPDALAKRLRDIVQDAVQMGVEVPEYLRRLIVVLERGGFDVHLRAEELEPLLQRGERIGHQVVAGAVIAATINGMAYLLASDPERWKRYHVPLIAGGATTVGTLAGYLVLSTNVPRVRRLARAVRGRPRF